MPADTYQAPLPGRAGRQARLPSVDCLRGLTMAGMVLVNNPGDFLHVYPQLRHAVWDGWTLADFVFPLFLFLVGVCVPLAIPRERALAGGSGAFWAKVLRRAAILFALGLCENVFLRLSFAQLRLPGVLQRIALVYLAAAWLHVRLGNRGLVAGIGGVLLGYWLLLALVPVPGLGRPSLGREANLEGWLDQLVLAGHIWRQGTSWDPEGILSTFPAVALGLVGVLAGRWLRAGRWSAGRVAGLGLGICLLGLAWNEVFPINKSLCSSSFVLFVGGVGIMLLAGARRLLDGRDGTAWVRPLLVLGRNPLVVYLAASTLASTLRHLRVADGQGGLVSLQVFLYDVFFAGWPWPCLASLAWGGLMLLVMYLGARWLDARRLVISV